MKPTERRSLRTSELTVKPTERRSLRISELTVKPTEQNTTLICVSMLVKGAKQRKMPPPVVRTPETALEKNPPTFYLCERKKSMAFTPAKRCTLAFCKKKSGETIIVKLPEGAARANDIVEVIDTGIFRVNETVDLTDGGVAYRLYSETRPIYAALGTYKSHWRRPEGLRGEEGRNDE